MAEINFPTSPTDGEFFSSGGKFWTYSASVTAWNLLSTGFVGPPGRSANAGQWFLANPDYLEPPGFLSYSYDTSQTASSNTLNINGTAVNGGFWNTWLEIVDSPFQVLLTTDNNAGVITALTNYQIFDVSGPSSFVLASPSFYSYYRVPVTLNSSGGTGTTGFAPSSTVNIFFLQAEGPTGASGQWDTAQTIENKTASYTLVTADAGKLITMTVAAANNLTVDGSLNLSVGQRIDIAQMAAGQTTVVASGTTVVATPTLKLRAQYSAASLICTAADTYLLVGDLAVI
jgi:hypothetical protein